jgi:hypothetical protein
MRLMATLVFAAMIGWPAAAQAETPLEIVQGIYAGGLTRSSMERLRAPANRGRYFQPALVRLFAAHDREECIDFALTSDGQDYDQAEISRTIQMEPRTEGDRASVDVRFMSMGMPNHYRYDFVRVGNDWKIADIASLGTGQWRLSQTRCGRAGRPATERVAGSAPVASPAGSYCYRDRHALLRLDVGSNGTARFRMETVGGNGHSCHVEGNASRTPQGWRYERREPGGPCQLDFTRTRSGAISVSDRNHICRLTYCGARASLETANLPRSSNVAHCAS